MRDSIIRRLSRLFIIILLLSGIDPLSAQVSSGSRWTFIEGENKPNTPGVYGTRGVAAPGNKPGARTAAGRWKDAAGNLWLFGGFGLDGNGASGYLNDLWKFTVATGRWTWIGGERTITQTNGVFGTQGVPAATNWPGSRDSRSLSWTDDKGDFWLFGGSKTIGSSSQVLNDLWRFDPATSTWTWMTGSQSGGATGVYGRKGIPDKDNSPGGKHSAVGWADGKGNLWLYGGVSPVDAYQNDLWQFHIASRQWTWEGGEQGARAIPVYGVKGFGGPNNTPGGRYAGTSWSDSRGDLWMYGGFAVYSAGASGQVANDLWRYDVSRKEWVWESGDPLPNLPTSYGLLNLGILGNNPGNRTNAAGWSDGSENFYLFGGVNFQDRRYGDLWRYNTTTRFWTWIGGDNGFDQPPVYAPKRSFLATSKPGSRSKANTWVDSEGNLMLFGGSATVGGSEVQLNDLWQFGAAADCVPPAGIVFPANVDTCFGSTVLLHATNGFTAYQWYRDNVLITGATDSLYNATTSGNYTVVLEAGTECAAAASNGATVLINPVLQVARVDARQPSCANNTGDLVITAAGGSGTGIQYSRDNGITFQSSNIFESLPPGNYQVVVRDDNNCVSAAFPITLNAAATSPVTVTGSHTNVTCAGLNTGSITVSAANGATPYQYRLGTGPLQPTGSFPNLTAGTYVVNIIDANSCTKDTTITVLPAANNVTVTGSHTNVTCAGLNTGSITVTAANGATPYQYRLGTGPLQPTGSFPNLTAGTYVVNIIDANSCTKDTTITVLPAANNVTVTGSHTNVTCAGLNTGSITVTAANGATPYQYRLGTGPLQPTGSFPNLTAGTYVVNIIDANSCTKDTTITVLPAANNVTVTGSHTNVTCAGLNTGSITVTAANGATPYQYRLGTGALQPTGSFNNLTAGTYVVNIIDANSCTKDTSITVLPAANNVTVTGSHTNVTCAGLNTGSITVTAANGATPYQYRLGTGPLQPTGSFPNLTAGTYVVNIIDANSCTKDTSITVLPAANNVTVTGSHTNVTCAGLNTGSITVTAVNGATPYQYRLGTGPLQPTGSFPNLTAGTYVVNIIDANSCTKDTTITVLPAANNVTVTGSHTNVTCAGLNTGSITVTAASGATPYQYRLGTGALQPTGSFNNLTAGTYVVNIIDANSCQKDTSITVLPAANNVTVTGSHTNVTCAGLNTGSITVTAANGATPYQYRLGTGPLQPTGSFPNLTAGTYVVNIIDANSCTKDTSITVLPAANNVTVTGSHTNVTCAGLNTGSITVTAANGATPYQYRLGTGPLQPTGSFNNLTAATYLVRIIDANSCTKDTTITVLPAANNVTVTGSHTNVTCAGLNTGSITVTAANGATPYQYRLGTGALQPTGSFNNLTAGTYVVNIIDANSCTKDTSITVLPAANNVTVTGSHTNVTCAGLNTGSITVTAANGATPYQYRLGTGPLQPTGSFPNLTAGTYVVNIIDANSCTKDTSITVLPAANNVTVTGSHTNVTCAGLNTGSITVTAANGATPYQYRLGTGPLQPTGSFPNLTAGTYVVNIIDANSCTKDTTITVLPAANNVTVTGSHTNVTCAGLNTGSIAVTAASGATPYQYRLGTGALQPTGSFNNLTAGTYVVNIIDANSCQKDTSITVLPAANNVTVTGSHTNVTCAGLNTGSITVTAANGATPYQYRLGTGALQPTGSFPSLTAGTYLVRIVDANSCTKDTSITVLPAANNVTVTGSHTNVTCAGLNTGSITVTAANGATPYQYRLGTGALQPTGSFNNLTAGTYVVNIIDANSCQKDTSITVLPAANNVTVTGSHTNVTCAGLNTGSITVTAANGATPYQYRLGTGPLQPTGSFPNLTAGTYVVNIIDANSCTKDTSITVLPAANNVTVTGSHTNVTCAGLNTGSITVTAANGATPYQYRLGTGPLQPTGSFNNLTAATYLVRIIDANSCTKDTTITVLPAANNVTVTGSHTNVTCAGLNTGSITVTAANGATPYQYRLGTGALQPTGSFNNLTAGTYVVNIIDANSCTKDTSITVLPAANNVTVTGSHTNVTCAGLNTGSITVTAANGATPYQYRLGTGPLQPTGSFSNVTAGTYLVRIIDANSCTKDTSITVLPAANNVTINATHTNVTCASATSGSITATGGGGTTPYTYSLNAGAFQPTGTFSNLPAGVYTVTVRSNDNCTKDTSITIITAGSTVSATLAKTDVTCAGPTSGSVTVTGNGGTGPYQYRIGTNAFQGSGAFPNLAAGIYNISIRDANSCQKDTSITINTAANNVTINATHTNVTCASATSGSITATGGGGTTPYTYSLNAGAFQPTGTFSNLPAGVYTVTVRSNDNCTKDTSITIITAGSTVSATLAKTDVTCAGPTSGSVTVTGNGGTGPYQYRIGTNAFQGSGAFPNLAAGIYNISIRDANSCQKDTSITINTAPNNVTINATHTNVTCASANSGSITATGGGGTTPYTYSLNAGAFQPTGTFNNLPAGVYTVTVRSNDNCTKDTSITIITAGSTVSATLAKTDVTCAGPTSGSVTVTGNGGTGPYQYRIGTNAFQGSGAFPNLAAGTYNISIRDANSCQKDTSITINTAANNVTINATHTNVTCASATSGSITATGGGGTTPYTYSLNAGAFQPAGTFNNLPAGVYTVTVRSNDNCTKDTSITIITAGSTVSATLAKTDVTCAGPTSGAVTVTGNGGTGPYQYRIGTNAFQGSGAFPNLAAGTYNISIRDANSCQKDTSITIGTAPNNVTINATHTNVTCASATSGSITATGGGGTTPYTYSLNAGAFQPTGTFSNLPAGVYTVTVRSNDNCTKDTSITIITAGSTVTVTVLNQTNVSCAGGNTGAVTVAGTGGTGPYTYQIDGGAFQTIATFGNLAAGPHTVIARDANGCTDSETFTITQLANTVAASIAAKTDIPCIGGTGSVTIGGTGGSTPYEYSVGAGAFQASPLFTTLPAGNYNANVRDAVGCLSSIPFTITQTPNTITAVVGSKTDIPCSGGTGSVTINAAGGTAPYSYRLGTGVAQAGATFTNLPAGDYVITVNDALGCTQTVNVSIVASVSSVLATVTSKSDIPCTGGTGSLVVTGSGGLAPYQYQINGGPSQPTGSFTSLPAGSYSVTVTDANGCAGTIAAIITQALNTVTAGIASKTDIPCIGGTGSVTISGGGGTAPYTYKLGALPFQGSPTFNGLPAGDYIATVRDASGCTQDVSVSIIQTPNTITVNVTETDVPCSGGTGSIAVTGGGGIAPYQYRLGAQPFQASGVFSGLPAGSYTVSVRDASGCIRDRPVVVVQTPNTVVASLVSKTDIPCSGGNIGSATVAGSGGTAPYTYRAGTAAFQASPTLTNLPAGDNIITVRDANGCTNSITVNIGQLNNTVSAIITNRIDVPCSGGAPGSVTIVGTGGTAPYQYRLGAAPAAFRTDGNFIGLSAGSYTFTVRDALGCMKDTVITINQINSTVTNVLGSKTDVSCLGGNTGSITVVAGGGTAPYLYKIGTGAYGQSPTFSNLPAGTYTVTVQDAGGCIKDLIVPIIQTPNSIAPAVVNQTNIPCAGGNVGSVTVTATGGAAPYTYRLGSGSFSANPTFGNLAAGEYLITVRDLTGCTKDLPVNITQTANTVRPTVVKTDIPCGGGTGSIVVTGTGGTGPYLYRIGNGAYQPNGTFNSLIAGSYTVSVQDAGGCTRDTTLPIIQTPNTLNANTASKINIGCASGNIGSITVTATGGTAPYEYRIGSGAYQTSPTFANLSAGNFVITVKDAAGCTDLVNENITQTPNTVTMAVVKTDVSCAGGNTGSIVATGGGGSAPFEYKLGNGAYQSNGTFNNLGAGSYVVTVKNALGCTRDSTVVISQAENTIVASIGSQIDVPCSGGNGGSVTITASGGRGALTFKIGSGNYQSGRTFIGLAAGDYVVTVRDTAGCTRDVPVKIGQINNTVRATVSPRAELPCSAGNVGSITVIPGGGTAPYTFKLDSGQYQPGATFPNLGAGTYKITVRDNIGCTYEFLDTIKQANNTLDAAVGVKTDVSCSGTPGSVTISATGGTAPYQYRLGNFDYGTTATFNNISGGDYTVTVKDAAGCIDEVKFTIASPGGTPGTITPATADPICDGTSQLLTASDGASYQWFRNDTLIPGATSKTYQAAIAGKYNVAIGNGTCSIRAGTTVTITVNSCTETVVFVAKAFTPNNNNTNDKLAPRFINVKQFRYFKVYNRWGQLVYETSSIGEGWDGTFKGVRQPMETYSWILEAVDNNGKTIRTSGKTILIR